jgi:hypothetical protein
MKFYQVHILHDAGTSVMFKYYTRKNDAQKAVDAWNEDHNGDSHDATIDMIEIEPTKLGILRALNRYASHADNG